MLTKYKKKCIEYTAKSLPVKNRSEFKKYVRLFCNVLGTDMKVGTMKQFGLMLVDAGTEPEQERKTKKRKRDQEIDNTKVFKCVMELVCNPWFHHNKFHKELSEQITDRSSHPYKLAHTTAKRLWDAAEKNKKISKSYFPGPSEELVALSQYLKSINSGVCGRSWPNKSRDCFVQVQLEADKAPVVVFNKSLREEHIIQEIFDGMETTAVSALDVTNIPTWLSEQQVAAIRHAAQFRLTLVTGFPGTGKTTMLKSLISVLQHNNVKFFVLTPFNKAVARMKEMKIPNACTCDSFIATMKLRGAKSRVPAETERLYVIIDECSVLSPRHVAGILDVTHRHDDMSVVLLGDADQLPPICAGSIFSDFISRYSKRCVHLTEIKRQDSVPLLTLYANLRADMTAIPSGVPVQWLTPKATIDIPEFEFKGTCIVLSYFNNIVNAQNEIIRARHATWLQKTRPVNWFAHNWYYTKERPKGKRLFEGERLIADSRCECSAVTKGTMGVLRNVVKNKKHCPFSECDMVFTVKVPGQPEFKSCAKIWKSSYAITFHKAQGSEWDKVIVVLPFAGNYVTKRAIYTAVTRAKTSLILKINKHAWSSAVNRNDSLVGTTLINYDVTKRPRTKSTSPVYFDDGKDPLARQFRSEFAKLFVSYK